MNIDSSIFIRKGVLCATILLICGSLVPAVLAQEISERSPGLYSTDDLISSLSALPKNKLIIQSASSLSGSLSIQVGEGAGLAVSYVKQARTTSRSRAFDFIDLISINLSMNGDGGKIVLRAPNPAPWGEGPESGIVQLVVTVPPECFIEIEAVAFDVNVTGPLSGLVVPRSLGRMNVKNVHGRLDLKTVNQKIYIEDISGQISASTTNSTLLARQIRAHDETAHFKNTEGEIKIVDFEGGLNVRNNLGRIEIIDYIPFGESNFVSGSSAPISVDIIDMSEGQLVIKNKNEDIEIGVPDSLNAFYFLSVGDNGEIDASNLPVRTELVKHGRLNLISGVGGVDITGSIRGEGNIYLRGLETE